MEIKTELTTSRLILEPLDTRHAALVFERLCDSGLYAFIPRDAPESVVALEKKYSLLSVGVSPSGDEIWGNWVILTRHDCTVVGLLEATLRDCKSAYLAYMIFRDFRRRGYAEEALGALITWLQANSTVQHFWAEVDTRNLPSQRLLERLNFQRTGETKRAAFFKGHWSDEYRYERVFVGRETAEATCTPRSPDCRF
jgi:ribosomal-protein-alanine N-acetyltransferase